MKTSKRNKLLNFLLLVVIVLLIIPQSRVQLQIWLHKGFSYVNQSSIIENDERKTITNSDWQLKSDSGNILNFKNTAGRVVFINFWATWCPPCIAEMPSIQKLYDDYNGKIEFLLVTKDDFEKVKTFKSKNDFTFEVYNPLTKTPELIRAGSIPRTFIINKKGEIVVDESGAIDWNSHKVRKQLDALLLD